MKLSDFDNYATLDKYMTGRNLILGGVALILVGWGLTCAQASCERKHETNAVVAEAKADVHAEQLADLKQQLAGKETEIASLKSQGQALIKKYAAAKSKIPLAPLPAPIGEPALAKALVAIGMGDGTQVQIGVPSTLNTTDAALVFNLGQKAERAAQLEEALSACDGALKASEAVQQAQEEGLKLSGEALRHSQAEAAARAAQAQEIGKALKVEKSKRWQKFAWFVGGVVLTGAVKK